MAKKPQCKCVPTGYVMERLRGPDGKFHKTSITPLLRVTDCPLHRRETHGKE